MSRYFDGTSSDSIKQTGLPQVNTGTICMWARPMAYPQFPNATLFTFCQAGDSPQYGTYDKCFFMDQFGVPMAYVYDGGLQTATGSTAMTIGKWYHLTMTIDGVNIVLYVNGKQEASTPAASSYNGYSGPSFELSTATGGGNTRFVGNIADVAIWSRVLQPAHILALSRGRSPYSMSQGLISYLPLTGSVVRNLKMITKPTVAGTRVTSQPMVSMNPVSFYKRVRSLGKSPTFVKTIVGLAKSSVKTINGLAIGSIKKISNLT